MTQVRLLGATSSAVRDVVTFRRHDRHSSRRAPPIVRWRKRARSYLLASGCWRRSTSSFHSGYGDQAEGGDDTNEMRVPEETRILQGIGHNGGARRWRGRSRLCACGGCSGCSDQFRGSERFGSIERFCFSRTASKRFGASRRFPSRRTQPSGWNHTARRDRRYRTAPRGAAPGRADLHERL